MREASPRIALIHATPLAMGPIRTAFAENWPDARTFDLLESALSEDVSACAASAIDFDARFRTLTRYVCDVGAEGVLFSCSAFGSHIEKAARDVSPIPVLKPNEAMFEAALGMSDEIAMVATFAPAVPEMRAEFEAMADRLRPGARLSVAIANGAIEALRAGDVETHDGLCAESARNLDGADVLLLAHFSTARAQRRVAEAVDVEVLTSPQSAVRKLRRALAVT